MGVLPGSSSPPLLLRPFGSCLPLALSLLYYPTHQPPTTPPPPPPPQTAALLLPAINAARSAQGDTPAAGYLHDITRGGFHDALPPAVAALRRLVAGHAAAMAAAGAAAPPAAASGGRHRCHRLRVTVSSFPLTGHS